MRRKYEAKCDFYTMMITITGQQWAANDESVRLDLYHAAVDWRSAGYGRLNRHI